MFLSRGFGVSGECTSPSRNLRNLCLSAMTRTEDISQADRFRAVQSSAKGPCTFLYTGLGFGEVTVIGPKKLGRND